jgi:probable F420-dependent oxidoreductase
MKFGLTAPYLTGPIEEGDYAIRFARLAEELGFESVWVWEHVVMSVEYAPVYPYDPSGRSPLGAEVTLPDPLIWLTWVAAATTRIRLATGVLILPQRNPVVLAKSLASIDCLSSGRMMLGIGVGWLREEAEAIGTDFGDRGRRTSEYIDAMRCLWREPVSSFQGQYHRFSGVVSRPKPVQRGGIPIIVGGHSQAAARRAGRQGDGFYPLGVDLEEMRALVEVMNRAAWEVGRDPAAIEITMGGGADPDLVAQYADAGVGRIVVFPTTGDLDQLRAGLEPFARDVIPRFE